MSELDRYMESDKFARREKLVLRYTDAIIGNPLDADDALWKELHEEFTEPELVALGFYIGFRVGGQRWIMTFGPKHGEYEAFLVEKRKKAGAAARRTSR